MSVAAERTVARSSGSLLDMAGTAMPADYPSDVANRRPDAIAIVCGGRRWSYLELDRASNAFVAVLREAGIKRGDRVAYFGKNSDLYFSILFGAMRAGVVLVPVNWRNTAIETRFVLQDSEARLVIHDTEFLGVVYGAVGDVMPRIEVDVLRELLAETDPSPRAPIDPFAPALLLYTSGTTGQPKGVVTTQYHLAAQRRAENGSGHFNDWSDDETIFSPLPNFHIGGMSWALCGLARGLPVILSDNSSPAAILDAIVEFGVTRSFMVPTLVRALISEVQARGIERLPLRGIHYGAAPMDPQLLERSVDTLGCRFLQYFGMTEAGGTVTILGPDLHDRARPHLLRSVGQPLPGSTIEVRGPDARPLLVDESGEIWITGPSLTAGYWKQAEATANAFVDGWYRSGDGGRIDAEGFLYLTDRIKDMIVSGGENVYPAEVEAALREHPAILDCAVFGLPHTKWGEGVTAAVELMPGQTTTPSEVIDFARQYLAAYKIPRRIELGVTLPRTASGKVQRGALRAAFLERN